MSALLKEFAKHIFYSSHNRHFRLIIGLLACLAASCHAGAFFNNTPCSSYSSHKQYIVSEIILPSNPLEYTSDLDRNQVNENGFGSFVQGTKALTGYVLSDVVKYGADKRASALMIDIMTNEQNDCMAIGVNIAMPHSQPITGDSAEEFISIPGQRWLSLPAEQIGGYIVTSEINNPSPIIPPYIDIYLNSSQIPDKLEYIPFRVYNPQFRIKHISADYIEMQLNGALDATLQEQILASPVARIITDYINAYPAKPESDAVITIVEDGEISRQKCDANINDCCRPWNNMSDHKATCKILPAEIRASQYLKRSLKPDISVFSSGKWLPNPAEPIKDGISFGLLLRAIPAKHKATCESGTFCRDSRFPPADRPDLATVSLRRMWGQSFNDIWLASYSSNVGDMFHFDGVTWRHSARLSLDQDFSIESLDGDRRDNVYVTGPGFEQPRQWNGITWRPLFPKPPVPLYHIVTDGHGGIYGVSDAGGSGPGAIHHLADGVWKTEYTKSDNRGIIRIIALENEIVASGRQSMVFRKSLDVWTPEDVGSVVGKPASSLHGLWGNSQKNIWVGGSGGFCARWNGAGWELLPWCSAAGGEIRGFFGVGDEQIWLIEKQEDGSSARDSVRWRRDSALTGPLRAWQPDSTTRIYGIWGQGADDVWVMGGEGSLWKYQP